MSIKTPHKGLEKDDRWNSPPLLFVFLEKRSSVVSTIEVVAQEVVVENE